MEPALRLGPERLVEGTASRVPRGDVARVREVPGLWVAVVVLAAVAAVEMSDEDRAVVERAIASAKRRNPAIEESVFNFLRDILLFSLLPLATSLFVLMPLFGAGVLGLELGEGPYPFVGEALRHLFFGVCLAENYVLLRAARDEAPHDPREGWFRRPSAD